MIRLQKIDNSKIKLKAYSLVEIVLYLGLFAIIFTIIISFFLTIDEFTKNDQYQINTERAAVFVAESLDETFKNAKSIDAVNSHFGVDIGDITVIKQDGTSVKYSVSNNRISATTTSANFISGTGFSINKFRFDQIVNSGVTVGVKFELTMTSNQSSAANKDIITTYIIE